MKLQSPLFKKDFNTQFTKIEIKFDVQNSKIPSSNGKVNLSELGNWVTGRKVHLPDIKFEAVPPVQI